jgi:hypothetical protein
MSSIDDKAFWDKRTAELDSAARTSAEFDGTLTSRKIALQDKIAAASSDVFLAANVPAMEAELAEVQAQLDAARDAEWTVETTQRRRNEWNARVKAGEFNERGKISPLKVRNAERAQGWYTSDLKAAIERLGL